MEGSYQRGQPDAVHHHVFGGGIHQPASEQPNHAAPPWIPPSSNFPAPGGGAAFGGSHFPLPYGFNPSVPPPPFGSPPPSHFPGIAPPDPGNGFRSSGPPTFQGGPQQFGTAPPRTYCGFRQREEYRDGELSCGGSPCPLQDRDSRWETAAPAEDEEGLQRRQDRQWLARFLQSRGRTASGPLQRSSLGSVPAFREALYGAARLLSRLQELCRTLQHDLHADSGWSESYLTALQVKKELQAGVDKLTDSQSLDALKVKVARIAKRRARRLRAKKELQMEKELAEELSSEKEASIDKWRMRQIQQVEERKKEQELKLSADAVLCEVRKKQADVKRMQDVMRSLEKLRKLRKEVASRKGITTELQCDEVFSSQLEQLRSVVKRRTELYSAEEKALMVMLEGEQQEERRKEQERRAKKERARQLERKRSANSMLFGDELPADGVLQPFTEYYSQSEHSLQALIRIRRDWDAFLVAADHPDGSSVPQSWVLPESPSDQTWGSALQAAADGL
uniref:Programmed cell death 7 n=1 Tax=Fundulus heteroclitus TaxID=8078 RepID=A0A3Q2UMI9_FUNHE